MSSRRINAEASETALAKVLMELYAVWYFQPDKTPEQFDVMDTAARMLSKFPAITMSTEDIRKKYPPK